MKAHKYILAVVWICLVLTLFLGQASADYKTHPKGADLNFSITSNFATSCNLSTINSPTGIIEIGQNVLGSGTFNFNILGDNLTLIGDTCMNIVCTDGSTYTTGRECFEITLSGTKRDTTLIVSNIFLILLILGIMYVLHYKYKSIDYKESNNKIGESHNGNWGRTFIKTLGNNLMRNSFLWYYSLGWLLLIVLRELVYIFNTEEIYNFFLLALDIYSFGFFLVIVVWIGILIHHFRFITELISELNLGVRE